MLTARSFGFLPRQAMLSLVICEEDIDGKRTKMKLDLKRGKLSLIRSHV